MIEPGITKGTPGGRYKAIVVGGSAGSGDAMDTILSGLPADFEIPVLIVRHLHPSDNGSLARHLKRFTQVHVMEPCDKQPIERSSMYIAPANYHMLVEKAGTISLCIGEKVNWSRPSVDVLFESAALAWGARVVAVILSGASSDGTKGLQAIKARGGMTIAQNPEDAEVPYMPRSAMNANAIDHVLDAGQIGRLLAGLSGGVDDHDMAAIAKLDRCDGAA